MLEYNGYHATVTYDADDELFIGEVSGITDLLKFHDSSIEELKQMFVNCIDNYLEVCKQTRKDLEKEFKRKNLKEVLMSGFHQICINKSQLWRHSRRYH